MLITGHRGCGVETGNTLRALKKGMECADFVEVDVRMSRDNEPVVIHEIGISGGLMLTLFP